MERDGLGRDQWSYTVMIHGHCDKGRIEEAMYYFNEMTSKGMVPEPRIKILVDAMNIKLKERLGEPRDTGVMKRDMRLQLQYEA
ncbi:hypothetical protein RHGRI_018389 [Rhododendron griersonianum]|uniref:Pentatricopeptide repeat-containing protein n=1 Tax=Rhododendron griersonianum TaxID=479676 RepID=A0AAV6K182_9ERIC|nr:hypothetical protein RHGRI_018389 [Rhododendron griersonianum]